MSSPVLFLLAALLFPSASDKDALKNRYDKKFLVVLREGLAVGLCSSPTRMPLGIEPPTLPVKVSGDAASYREETGFRTMGSGCASIAPEPVSKGEILLVKRVWSHGDHFNIVVVSQPREVERTAGAAYELKRKRTEVGFADLAFQSSNLKDADGVIALIDRWVKPFDDVADARIFAKTILEPATKDIKLGMSVADVEKAFGAPVTRVDLGEKLIYRYKDMVVEFHDGKVSDVR